MTAGNIHLVRVTITGDAHRLWAAATDREQAVERVLDRVPPGAQARLLDPRLKPRADIVLGMRPGEVRELL